MVVATGAGDVLILRNLQINGADSMPGSGSRGIEASSGGKLIVENCDVFNFGKRGISIESSMSAAVGEHRKHKRER